MRSLYTDPLSWWPIGFVIGGVIGAVIGAVVHRRDRRRTYPLLPHGDDGAPTGGDSHRLVPPPDADLRAL